MNKASELPPRMTNGSHADSAADVQPIDMVALAIVWDSHRHAQEAAIDVDGLQADLGIKVADPIYLKGIERIARRLSEGVKPP